MVVADGRPDGQVNGSAMLPTALVLKGSVSSAGNGTSMPPLTGTGVLESDTNSVAGTEGLPKVRSISAGVPSTCEPVPFRNGVPNTPGRPEPSAVQVPWLPWLGGVNGTGSEAMPLA